MRTVQLGPVASTNKYCEALDLTKVEDFTCYWTMEQTAGIGQRGNRWESAAGENLTFSVVVHPRFLPAGRQFRLTQALSLAVCDQVEALGIAEKVWIKWPNDIYAGGGKLCGMLTTVRLAGETMESAVCGVGLNVNQTDFPAWVPHPVSLKALTGRDYDLRGVLDSLLVCIERRYISLRQGEDQQEAYLARLMNRGVAARYRYGGEVVEAVVEGVDGNGRLLLDVADGRRLCCGMKEIALAD